MKSKKSEKNRKFTQKMTAYNMNKKILTKKVTE